MRAEEIEKIRDGKQKAAQNNYQWFQQSGDDKYYRAYKRYDDLVEICNQALTVAEDRDKANRLTADFMVLARKAADMRHHGEYNNPAAMNDFLYELVDVAKCFGFSNMWE